ncbi:DUF4760 domain-containing protein [Streptomyces zagrosensis]|uniref:Uncharacterized protein n=1 Tax=Streptomyces zagrosensis TaxID=1042984 RepID=A0A7W9V173_9ACTN|nr:hypothetical protein [Streptomyces zagrosensis]MBB5938973.1 hypothetical protein [Streptomyces zagrosensis]
MDATITLNLAALFISLAALIVSILLTQRQIRLSNGGNHLPVILEAFKMHHNPAYLEAEKYLLHELAQEHSADCGCTGLPEPARTHALTIGMYFDDLGKLVAHDVIDQNLIVGSYGVEGIVCMWDALAPYVYQQRRTHDNHFWIYFENLAARTAATPNSLVYAALSLCSRPPQQPPRTPRPN